MLRNAIAALAAACALGAAGCEATITPGSAVVAVTGEGLIAPVAVVPADVWVSPRVFFGGEYVYLVNGLWYRPTPQGWFVYRREPVELARQRVRIYASPRPSYVPRTPQYAYPPSAPRERGRERTPLPR